MMRPHFGRALSRCFGVFPARTPRSLHCRRGSSRAFTSSDKEEFVIQAVARFVSVFNHAVAIDSSWLLRIFWFPIVSAHCAAVCGSVDHHAPGVSRHRCIARLPAGNVPSHAPAA